MPERYAATWATHSLPSRRNITPEKFTLCILRKVKLQMTVSAAEDLTCFAPTKPLASRVSTTQRQPNVTAPVSPTANAVRPNQCANIHGSHIGCSISYTVYCWNQYHSKNDLTGNPGSLFISECRWRKLFIRTLNSGWTWTNRFLVAY